MDITEEENLEELLAGVNELAKVMKQRLTEMHIKGKTNWKEISPEHAAYQIGQVGDEVKLNPYKDIDTANWCLIHWMNRSKQEAKVKSWKNSK